MGFAPSVSPRRRGDPPPPVLRTDGGNSPSLRLCACLPMRSRGRWIACRASETEGDRAVWRGLSGQNQRRGACGIHVGTAADHPESRNDVLHQLDERAQHRAQQELGERWRADLVCVCSYRCHGRDYTRARGPVGSGGRYPTKSGASGLRSRAKISGCPANSAGLYPTLERGSRAWFQGADERTAA